MCYGRRKEVSMGWLLKWFRPVNLWCECAKKYESVSNRCWPPHDSKQREKQELKISPSCWLFSCPYRENTWSIEYATTQCVRYAIRKTIKCAKPKIRQGNINTHCRPVHSQCNSKPKNAQFCFGFEVVKCKCVECSISQSLETYIELDIINMISCTQALILCIA